MKQYSERKCKDCGKLFKPVSGRQYYCKSIHYKTCPICNKIVEVVPTDYFTSCLDCKDEIKAKGSEKRKQTNISKYGSEHVVQSDYWRVKSKATSNLHYGVDNPMQCDSVKLKQQASTATSVGTPFALQSESSRIQKDVTNLSRYGVVNTYQIPDINNPNITKARITSIEKYGAPHFSQTDECKLKVATTNIERLGVPYPMQNRECHIKAAQTRKGNIASDGTKLDSSYERLFYEYCLRLGLSVQRQIPVSYMFQGKENTTFIDFKVSDILFEVKGGHLMDGCFDYQGVPIADKLEVYKQNHVVVITDNMCRDKFGKPNSSESNGLKYLHKCANPLIGVDIDLFREPEFPYAPDRPECFYDVRVAGQMSSFEAFNDELIRWKMILNRIYYSGGFIDGKQILNALNVTRTCKQPSWFSKGFAKELILRHITSNVIVDPFAGWGARADACAELRRAYIGVDLNSELVDWHNRFHRNISLGDAKDFKFNDECSVFICPPYQDVELYTATQDVGLTQCEWLEIVMKNVPNAKEYMMVCKVVDPGWEKYIVETKSNKSHFGMNNEYVLVVNNMISL